MKITIKVSTGHWYRAERSEDGVVKMIKVWKKDYMSLWYGWDTIASPWENHYEIKEEYPGWTHVPPQPQR